MLARRNFNDFWWLIISKRGVLLAIHNYIKLHVKSLANNAKVRSSLKFLLIRYSTSIHTRWRIDFMTLTLSRLQYLQLGRRLPQTPSSGRTSWGSPWPVWPPPLGRVTDPPSRTGNPSSSGEPPHRAHPQHPRASSAAETSKLSHAYLDTIQSTDITRCIFVPLYIF